MHSVENTFFFVVVTIKHLTFETFNWAKTVIWRMTEIIKYSNDKRKAKHKRTFFSFVYFFFFFYNKSNMHSSMRMILIIYVTNFMKYLLIENIWWLNQFVYFQFHLKSFLNFLSKTDAEQIGTKPVMFSGCNTKIL